MKYILVKELPKDFETVVNRHAEKGYVANGSAFSLPAYPYMFLMMELVEKRGGGRGKANKAE
jgi:hypothetical protein